MSDLLIDRSCRKLPEKHATEKVFRDAVCKETLSWVGTRYHDHAALKRGHRVGTGGVDCAGLPMRVAQHMGVVPADFVLPPYSPQQWLNSPSQTDKFHLRVVDETMLKIVQQFAREITEDQIGPGDLMLCLVVASWTHCAIIIEWPGYVIHPVKGLGVIASHAKNAGFWANCPKRFFTIVPEALIGK